MAAEHEQDGPIITFTDDAREKLLEFLDDKDLRGPGAIRIAIQGRGPGGFDYAMALEESDEPAPGETVAEQEGFKVLAEQHEFPLLVTMEPEPQEQRA